ncbi:unnamed protein product [Chironomus riparius]|uniref:Uncharacterized protein n=1 Tax=Chironomus riparius TaxID=315576 RepID=A0A9N9WRV1_9DIPT|nr:unnamed protein product [Chironomus riparius]
MDSTSKTSVQFSHKSSVVSISNRSTTSRGTLPSIAISTGTRSSTTISRSTRPSTGISSIASSVNGDRSESRKSRKIEKTFAVPVDIFNDPLYNEDGTRNERIPFELFIIRKQQEEREKNRKQVKVSTITRRDNTVFKEAIRKLKIDRARENVHKMKYIKALAKSRATDKGTRKVEAKKLFEQKYQCRLRCKERNEIRKRSKSRSRSKSNARKEIVKGILKYKRPVIKLPPLKMRPKKMEVQNENETECQKQDKKKPRFPAITIPPFKTRKWVPVINPKPSKPKVVIEYPPLKLRKKPWKPAQDTKAQKKIYRTLKLFYPIPFSTLGKTWHSFKFLSSKQQILSGKLTQYSKKFSFISNGKQSAFISIVALSTFDLHSMKSWKSFLLDEIISYGDINFRRQLKQLKHKSVIKPSNVYHKIYLKNAKFLVEIGEMTAKGIYDADNVADIHLHFKNIFEKFKSLIFLYNGQNYAIWEEDNAYYIFNAEDTNEKGKLIEKNRGGCCVIRSTSLSTIVEYLIDTFRVMKQLYEIFSFRVNQKLMIQDLKSPPKELGRVCEITNENIEAVDKPQVIDLDHQEIIAPKTGLSAVLFRHKIEPTFGDSFQYSSIPNHMFITCANYLNRGTKNRATFISSVAVVMLQICKSSLWMSTTMERIFKIGNEVYYENVEKVFTERERDELERLKAMHPAEMEPEPIEENSDIEDEDFDDNDDDDDEPKSLTKEQIRAIRRERLAKPHVETKIREEVPITEIKPAISIGKMKYEISVETLNIGKITSRKREELNLECGIISLFKQYDYGLIIGPDVVAVWRENSRYFMFDPNQCKAYRRFNDEDIEPYNSCLNCFQNLSDLIQLYIENLPKSNRNAIYKICKIESRDYKEKSTDWQNFKSVGQNKWILSGNICESSGEFDEDNRNHQSTCISITAIAKTREIGISSWTSNEIDEIVRIGDEFYSVCIENLKQKGKFESQNLVLTEIGTELKLENIIVDLNYEERVIEGISHANMSLSNGLNKFFKNDDLGIINFGLKALAVLKYNDAFFLFDSCGRDEFGRNYKTIDPIDACTVKGSACMLRFIKIEDLSNHLIMNFEEPHFSITKVEISVRSSQAPCLYNYKIFGEEPYGAILKAFNNYHEDCEEFKCESSLKTICNLLSCLCYANIFNPRFWAPNDLNEILKIGWKFLCKTFNSTDDLWEILKQVDVCSSKLKLEVLEEHQGIFMIKERILSGLSKLDEVIEDHTEISVINRSIDDQYNEVVNIRREDRSSMFQTLKLEGSIVLENVLQSFIQNDKSFAILSSSLFTIAIFRIENFYYVFDPKASMNGMLIRKRLEDFINNNLRKEHDMLLAKLKESNNSKRVSMEEKMEELIFGRKVIFGAPTVKPSQVEIVYTSSYGAVNSEDPISISEKGCAYVSWFSSIDLLHLHVINKIPERFLDEPFTMQFIDISKSEAEFSEVTMWNNFEKIHDNHWIIRGTFSQNDSQFPATHRNNQDVPNCILALAFKQFCNDEEWNTTVLDVILKFGDRLFRKSLAKKLSTASVNHEDLKLKFSELECPIFIRPFIIKCSEDMMHEDIIVKHSDEFPLENFKKVINDFLTGEENTGMLISKSYAVAIWKNNDGTFLMFDPHDIGPDGRRKFAGLSSLQRFTNSSDLVEIFWNNVKEFEGFNKFQLFKVKTELNHFKDGEQDIFESMEQEIVNPKFKMIVGKSASPNTTSVEMTICYAIAAHCLCQSLDAEYYTSDIVDRIIMFGNELVCECCTNDEVCFKDFNLDKYSSCPDEINWNFQLNDCFTTIQMDVFRRGVITTQPCPLPNLIFVLEEFFDFHCSGLLVTNEFIASLWKDNNEYYIFYSCRIDKSGNRSDSNGNVGLVIFKTVHDLYTNILNNIRFQASSFELRTCNIKMADNVGYSNQKTCTKKNNMRWMKNIAKEEIIMPAVSFREVEINENSIDASKHCKQDRKVMIENLKRCGSDKGFIKFSRGGFVCGKLSKNSKSLNEISRKFHSPAICLYSAAMHEVVNMNCWNSDVIDCIILSGNSLYVESSIVCGTSEVDITSIVSPILINNHELIAKAESCLDFALEDLKIAHLKSILCELLSCYNACYLSKARNFFTIVKSDKFYFLFDPLGIEILGKKMSQHRAVLYRFSELDQLLELLLESIECLDEEKLIDDVYKLGGILISINKKLTKKIVKKPRMIKKKIVKCIAFNVPRTNRNMILRKIPEKDQPVCCESRNIIC